ncbi:MAG: hypothetical protein Q3972_05300 [Corynebacterium sp.]|nr:hypothetical protein [Corynebacterium sp.]
MKFSKKILAGGIAASLIVGALSAPQAHADDIEANGMTKLGAGLVGSTAISSGSSASIVSSSVLSSASAVGSSNPAIWLYTKITQLLFALNPITPLGYLFMSIGAGSITPLKNWVTSS